MRIKWDDAKNASNLRKHGIGFDEAIKIFDDPHYISRADRVVDGEQRWQSFGTMRGMLVVMVAHTWFDADGDEYVRVISARRATRQEREDYEQDRFI